MRSRQILFAAVVASLAVPARAQMLNDGPPPQHRVVHRNLFALRVNPLGLLYEGRFMYRYRLHESPSPALRDNFVGLGAAATLSPAFLRIGPYLEVAPASMLTLWTSWQVVKYFGTFNLLQSFSSPNADFSDDEIKRRGALPDGDPSKNYAASGTELTFGADFQAKVSSIVVRTRTRLVRPDYDLRAGHTVQYDQFFDVLAPNRSFFFTNDADALYQTEDRKLIAGLRYTATLPLYGQRHFAPGEAASSPNDMHRLGPLVGYTFSSRDGARWNNPTVFVLLQWWLAHRFRTGQQTSQALPLFGAGFQLTGDFLGQER